MKKIISLFLALLMAFSVVTVAFATENTEEEPAEDEAIVDLGEYQWILDLPFWTVKPALKFAKIAFKLVSVYLKVAKVFGLVEEDMDDMILGAITDLISNSMNGETETEEEVTVATEVYA